jgi:hypothetical protein
MVKSHNKGVEGIFRANHYSWHFVPFFAAVYRRSRQSESGNVHVVPEKRSLVDRIVTRVKRRKIDDRLVAEFGGLAPGVGAMPSDEGSVEGPGR